MHTLPDVQIFKSIKMRYVDYGIILKMWNASNIAFLLLIIKLQKL